MKFKSVEEMQEAIDAYFLECVENSIPYTITGLALALGTNRQTLCNYEKAQGYEKFFDTIKKAKTRVENYAEIRLFGPTPAGAIFALKNFGWEDRSKHDIGGQPENPVVIKDDIPHGSEA